MSDPQQHALAALLGPCLGALLHWPLIHTRSWGATSSSRSYAKAYTAAADSVGAAACVAVASVAQNGTILRAQTVHTPADASSQQQEDQGSSSNTGVIVGVVVAVVAACLGECAGRCARKAGVACLQPAAARMTAHCVS